MVSRNVNFTFAAGVPTGNQSATQLLFLGVKDSTGAVVFAPTVIQATATSYSTPIPVGNGYVATLTARDTSSVFNVNPQSVTFDVPPPPPPPTPPDPILNPPTIS